MGPVGRENVVRGVEDRTWWGPGRVGERSGRRVVSIVPPHRSRRSIRQVCFFFVVCGFNYKRQSISLSSAIFITDGKLPSAVLSTDGKVSVCRM